MAPEARNYVAYIPIPNDYDDEYYEEYYDEGEYLDDYEYYEEYRPHRKMGSVRRMRVKN